MRSPRSLASRLVVTAVCLVAIVSLLIGIVTTLAMRNYLYDRLDSQVEASLDRTLHRSVDDDDDGPAGGPRDLGAGAGTEGGLTGVFPDSTKPLAFTMEFGADGRPVARPVSTTVKKELADVPDDGEEHTVHLTALGSYRVIAEAAPGGTVMSGLPTQDVDETLASLVWLEVLLGALGVAAAAGAGLLVVRRQLRPLNEVAATAHTVAELPLATGDIDLSERVPEHLTDERTEVGQVGAALNALLAHVESSLEARHRSEQQVRQFVADASHELRTPLATIAGYTELARRRPEDRATVGTALDKVTEESGRMTSLVEDLLLLARIDAGRPLERRPVDLSRVLIEAVSDARVLAPDHHWRLELPEEAVEVTGDEQRLHQVVTNLLTNARKHTPPGTTVTVRGRADGFAVHDDGPGFPAELVDHAFERFARGDVARNRGPAAAGGGAGLGLALVEAIVAAHGGRVGLTSCPGDTTILVTLPA